MVRSSAIVPAMAAAICNFKTRPKTDWGVGFDIRSPLTLTFRGVGFLVNNSAGKTGIVRNTSDMGWRGIRLPLVHFFEISFGRTTERRIILVRVTDAEGTEGWGECTAGEGPFYCEEWTETAWPTLKEFLAPIVVGQAVEDA